MIPAHKFVFKARSKDWGVENLDSISSLGKYLTSQTKNEFNFKITFSVRLELGKRRCDEFPAAVDLLRGGKSRVQERPFLSGFDESCIPFSPQRIGQPVSSIPIRFITRMKNIQQQ